MRSQSRALPHRLKSTAVGLFALFALIALAGSRAAFAQDADESDAAAWVRVDPDSSADTSGSDPSGEVLEIPQTACIKDGTAVPCDTASNPSDADGDDADQPIAVGGPPPASPQTFDDDTASAAPANSDDWGSADDYATQSPYGFPYATTQYGTVVARAPGYGTASGSPFPPMAMSNPLTPPGRPSLYPGGPWMTPPRMMTMARPAGSPMAGGAFRFH